jgi:hypothetical protein
MWLYTSSYCTQDSIYIPTDPPDTSFAMYWSPGLKPWPTFHTITPHPPTKSLPIVLKGVMTFADAQLAVVWAAPRVMWCAY